MGHKTAAKTKPKTRYVAFATFSKKGGLKILHSGKGVNVSGWKPNAGVVAEKSKVFQGSYELATQIHDADQGLDISVDPLAGAETDPGEHETELANQLVTEVANDSPDVNALCETYKLRREELGRLTGFSLRALAEWASGKLPSQPAKRRLQEVRRLLDALAEIIKRESIPKWLHQPNPAFDRLTPLQAIELGEIDRLWAMVHEMGSGQPE